MKKLDSEISHLFMQLENEKVGYIFNNHLVKFDITTF